MFSRARVARHPIHPMLVSLPIGLFTATTAALIAFIGTADPFYYRAAFIANLAGVATAIAAGIPGAIDLFHLPPTSPARATGLRHGKLALIATALFAGCAALLWRDWPPASILAATVPLAVAVAGMLSLVFAALLGWTLVQTHKVGVSPNHLRSVPLRFDAPPGRRVHLHR